MAGVDALAEHLVFCHQHTDSMVSFDMSLTEADATRTMVAGRLSVNSSLAGAADLAKQCATLNGAKAVAKRMLSVDPILSPFVVFADVESLAVRKEKEPSREVGLIAGKRNPFPNADVCYFDLEPFEGYLERMGDAGQPPPTGTEERDERDPHTNDDDGDDEEKNEDSPRDDDSNNDDPANKKQEAVPRTDSDMATFNTVKAINQQSQFRRDEQKQIDWLRLTSNEMQEMVDQSADYSRNEYFDMTHFSAQVEKVWEDRREEDLSPVSRKTVRLFNIESSILQHAAKQKVTQAPMGFIQDNTNKSGPGANSSDSYAMKHPLLHRRLARNSERREVFRQAAEERERIRSLPSVRNNDSSVQVSKIDSTSRERDLFPLSKRELAAPSALRPMSSSSIQEKRSPMVNRLPSTTTSADDAAAATPPPPPPNGDECQPDKAPLAIADRPLDSAAAAKPPTLHQMLKAQQSQLIETKRTDEEVYKPILHKYFCYTQAVQRKLSDLGRMKIRLTTTESGTEAIEFDYPSAEEDADANVQ